MIRNAVDTTTIRFRIYFDSISIRLQFDRSTTIRRQFDDLRYDWRPIPVMDWCTAAEI